MRVKFVVLPTVFLLLSISASFAEIEFRHMEEVKQCSLCHAKGRTKTREDLQLLDGERLAKDRPVAVLCGQCHGIRYRDWNAGLHGKQAGRWNAEKMKLDCVECHDPHSPRFKPMNAVALPVLPKFGRKHDDAPKHDPRQESDNQESDRRSSDVH